jgi:hypothetical protein
MNQQSVVVEKFNDIVVDSNPNNGALNVRDNGATFSVNFTPALSIPANAINPRVSVERLETFYTYPNISASIGNNKFYITENVTTYTVTIPDGLYSLDQLEASILTLAENQGLTANAIELNPDDATQRVVLVINQTNVSVEFKSDSPLEILGFNVGVIGPPVSAPFSYFAPNVAGFNATNSLQLRSDLVNQGISQNNIYQNILTNVQIDAPPGSQITYQPFRPLYASGESLRNANRSNVSFTLTDQDGVPVDTNNEVYSATIRITWQEIVQTQT